MKIAVVGSINADMMVIAERIPGKGETVLGKDLCYSPGGKGANQAVAMQKLGAQVEMFGCVGQDDQGRRMIENLQNMGVTTEHIEILDQVPTGLAVITVGEHDNSIVVIKGANEKVDCAYIDRIKSVLKTYDLVVLQHEIPSHTIHYVIEFCHQENIPVVLNPAPAAEVPVELMDMIAYLTPNEHEAKQIFGADRSLEELLRAYPEKLIVTQGSKGVVTCLKSGEMLEVPAKSVKVVDTTGAGDTLNGAFCVQIVKGADLKEALCYANTAAALSIGKLGAQSGMPTADEVEKALRED